MSGNTFGTLFTVTTFGESHGPAIGCIVDGCPPGLPLRGRHSAGTRPPPPRHFAPRHTTSGAGHGRNSVRCVSGHDNGTPIALLIRNQDQRSKDYGNITDSFRPGHADFTYWKKYGIRDPRGGGRSSARLTAPVVAAGAIAKKWLAAQFGTTFTGGMRQIGEVVIPFQSWEHVNQNPFFAPTADAAVLQQLEDYMDSIAQEAIPLVRVWMWLHNVPAGLGEPIYDKLDGNRVCHDGYQCGQRRGDW
jgi:chorismate synthase